MTLPLLPKQGTVATAPLLLCLSRLRYAASGIDVPCTTTLAEWLDRARSFL